MRRKCRSRNAFEPSCPRKLFYNHFWVGRETILTPFWESIALKTAPGDTHGTISRVNCSKNGSKECSRRHFGSQLSQKWLQEPFKATKNGSDGAPLVTPGRVGWRPWQTLEHSEPQNRKDLKKHPKNLFVCTKNGLHFDMFFNKN